MYSQCTKHVLGKKHTFEEYKRNVLKIYYKRIRMYKEYFMNVWESVRIHHECIRNALRM